MVCLATNNMKQSGDFRFLNSHEKVESFFLHLFLFHSVSEVRALMLSLSKHVSVSVHF